jgi:hypothetical protein
VPGCQAAKQDTAAVLAVGAAPDSLADSSNTLLEQQTEP